MDRLRARDIPRLGKEEVELGGETNSPSLGPPQTAHGEKLGQLPLGGQPHRAWVPARTLSEGQVEPQDSLHWDSILFPKFQAARTRPQPSA